MMRAVKPINVRPMPIHQHVNRTFSTYSALIKHIKTVATRPVVGFDITNKKYVIFRRLAIPKSNVVLNHNVFHVMRLLLPNPYRRKCNDVHTTRISYSSMSQKSPHSDHELLSRKSSDNKTKLSTKLSQVAEESWDFLSFFLYLWCLALFSVITLLIFGICYWVFVEMCRVLRTF